MSSAMNGGSGGGDDGWIERMKEISSVEGGSLTNVVPKALLLPVIAFFSSMADAIGSAFAVPIQTFRGFADGLGVLITGLLEPPGEILAAAGAESARSLTGGVWAQFGPFTYVIGTGVVLGAAYAVARYRAEDETSNFMPALPFDVPVFGTEEDE